MTPSILLQHVAFVVQLQRRFSLQLPVYEAGGGAERTGSNFKRCPSIILTLQKLKQ